jgi:hypothetical protein
MTANRFRKLALALPETVEQSHMDHPDFRVGGKIFASLGPDEDWGMVKLTPEEQASYVRTDADAFTPFKGAWGKRGCTKVTLKSADELTVRQALAAAWRNTAPKTLVAAHDTE